MIDEIGKAKQLYSSKMAIPRLHRFQAILSDRRALRTAVLL